MSGRSRGSVSFYNGGDDGCDEERRGLDDASNWKRGAVEEKGYVVVIVEIGGEVDIVSGCFEWDSDERRGRDMGIYIGD